MPWVGFKSTIPALERAKTVHALDRAATVIGRIKPSPKPDNQMKRFVLSQYSYYKHEAVKGDRESGTSKTKAYCLNSYYATI
jgi:hypothetical protein